MTTPYAATDRSKVRRIPDRGSHDRADIYGILDEGLVCHVGLVAHGQPVVIPMAYGRDGDRLVLHGSNISRIMTGMAEGAPVCVTVTLVDGVVLARSTFHSSMNYRSVVAFGTARRIEGNDSRKAALDVITDHIAKGRAGEARDPTAKELAVTEVIEVVIEEASAKIRTGPPSEPDYDVDLPVWAGVIPLTQAVGKPIPAPNLDPRNEASEVVTGWKRSTAKEP